MFLFYLLSFFKKGNTIQGGTLFKGGHYLRKYGKYIRSALLYLTYTILCIHRNVNQNKQSWVNCSKLEKVKMIFEHDRTIWRDLIEFCFVLPLATFLMTSYIILSWNKGNLLLELHISFPLKYLTTIIGEDWS